MQIGEYLGFKMNVTFDSFYQKFTLGLKGALTRPVEIGSDVFGNLTHISNVLEGMEAKLAKEQEILRNVENQLENAKEEVEKPFQQEQELNEKMERLAELNALLNMDEKGTEEYLDEPEEDSMEAAQEQAVPVRTSIMEKLQSIKSELSSDRKEPVAGISRKLEVAL